MGALRERETLTEEERGWDKEGAEREEETETERANETHGQMFAPPPFSFRKTEVQEQDGVEREAEGGDSGKRKREEGRKDGRRKDKRCGGIEKGG